MIEEFVKFTADEPIADVKCPVCQEEIVAGMDLFRLDCEGRHLICVKCAHGWFKDHKTCPTCRHEFA